MKTRPSIVLLLGYHAPDSAAWVAGVTGIAGDDMDVAVHRALAGGMANKQPGRAYDPFSRFVFQVPGPGLSSLSWTRWGCGV